MGPTGIFSFCLSLGSGPKRALILTVLFRHLKKKGDATMPTLFFDKEPKTYNGK
jgi:hypothetical protein